MKYGSKPHVLSLLFILLSPFHVLNGQNVSETVIRLVGDPTFKNGNLSFTLMDKISGALVATHNPNTALVPASSLKMLTCAYGLKVLGPEFRFQTTLETTGTINNQGVLQGDLILHGFGDPTLGSEVTNTGDDLNKVLAKFVQAVKAAGIKQIDGRIFGDASFFSDEGIYDTWSWYDLGNYYACGVYGLNIYDNLFKLFFKQSKQGTKPAVKQTFPTIPGLVLASQVISGRPGSGDNAYIFGGPMQYNRQIRGTIPPGSGDFEIKGSMPDPPLMAALLLRDALNDAGIVSGNAAASLADPLPKGLRKTIYTHHSIPLRQIIHQTMLKSININAEAILRYCEVKRLNTTSTAGALETFREFISQTTQQSDGFLLSDGSGLSPLNAVSSLGFAKALHTFSRDQSIADILLASLPVAGTSGTLSNFLNNSPSRGHLKAKTGSMNRVRSYTGILKGKSGKEFVFSLIMNNYSASGSEIKQKTETFFTELYNIL